MSCGLISLLSASGPCGLLPVCLSVSVSRVPSSYQDTCHRIWATLMQMFPSHLYICKDLMSKYGRILCGDRVG